MVIDFHVHAFNPKIAEKAISQLQARCGLVPYTRGLIEQTVERLDEWGIDKAVLLSVATKPSQQKIINSWAKEQDGGRFISFGSVYPGAEDCVDEVFAIKEMGLHGIKLHPDYQDFMIDDHKLDEVMVAAAEADLPVIFHSGYDVLSPELIHCQVKPALEMIKRNPKTKIILAHLGCNDYWQEVYDTLAGVGGEVYFDTAFTSHKCPDEIMEKIINKHGADRILFASDCPWDSPALIREKILRLNISSSHKEKILGKNAERLLNL